MLTRRAALAGIGALAATRVRAATPLTLLVGAQPGSRIDTSARGFVPFLLRHLPDTDITIRNLPGTGGLTALSALADAPADGSVFGWVTTPSLPARVVDRGAAGLLPRLRLLGSAAREPLVIVSPASAPLESVQDLIHRAAEDADAVPLGTPPPGSPPHLAAIRLQALAQTRLSVVTFPSSAAVRQAVIAGNVSAAVLGLSDVLAALHDGRLVGLGIAARKRAGILPDLPVLNEAGVPLSASIRRGLAAPAALPPDTATQLTTALQAVAEDDAFGEYAEATGLLVGWMDGAGWSAQVEMERAGLASLWASDPWLNADSG